MPGSLISAVYLAAPVTFRRPSRRGVGVPRLLGSLLGGSGGGSSAPMRRSSWRTSAPGMPTAKVALTGAGCGAEPALGRAARGVGVSPVGAAAGPDLGFAFGSVFDWPLEPAAGACLVWVASSGMAHAPFAVADCFAAANVASRTLGYVPQRHRLP